MISLATIERMHRQVRRWYRDAVLATAEAICDDRLSADLDQPPLLHLRGLLAIRSGYHELADSCFRRALALEPSNVACLADLGDLLARQTRFAEAELAYRSALALQPNVSGLLCRLSRALASQRRTREALAICELAVQHGPSHAFVHAERADLLDAEGRSSEALEHYTVAVNLEPTNPEWYRRLGNAWLRLGDYARAIQAYREGSRHQPERSDLHVKIGEVLLRQGDLTEAVTAFETALVLEPQSIKALQSLLCALELLGRREDAPAVWACLGKALASQGAFRQAAVAYDQALARQPRDLPAQLGRGYLHLQLNEPPQAIRCFEAVLRVAPHHAEAHQGLGQAAALSGDVVRYFDELTWFDQNSRSSRRYFEQPFWDGSSLYGRTILLWTNLPPAQTIQLARFAKLPQARGAKVVVECHRKLARLFQKIAGIDHVVTRGEPLPRFDVHAPFASLPRLARANLDTLRNDVPYIEADPGLSLEWQRRLGPSDQKRIGLVWGGGARLSAEMRQRFVPLATFASLARLAAVRLISLQGAPPPAERLTLPRGCHVDAIDAAGSAAELAALIQHLDLIITIDALTADVAGALGHPVWILLPYAADARWLNDRDTCTWYPTMRLFRQPCRGDWVSVLKRLQSALAELWPAVSAPSSWSDENERS